MAVADVAESDVDDQILEVALAVAEAVAEVTANCRAGGSGFIRARSYELALERAEEIGLEVEDILSSSTTLLGMCTECPAAVEALALASQQAISAGVEASWKSVRKVNTATCPSYIHSKALRKRLSDRLQACLLSCKNCEHP